MGKKNTDGTDLARKRRIQELQLLHEKMLAHQDTSKISRLTKVAYILWQYPNTRDSDRTHALQYYKIFHPELVANDQITFENIYNLPKMYDLQRDRATIQNTQELFPPKLATSKKRKERASDYQTYYRNSNLKTFLNDENYYIYLDESGKNNKYFVLAGIMVNSVEHKRAIETSLSAIREKLNQKYNIQINEWKFSNINKNNKNYYFELLDEVKALNYNLAFVSILVENSGLSSNSKKNKTKELLKFIIKDCLDILMLYTCRSSYGNVVSKLNVVLDNDGAGIDILQQAQIKSEIQTSVCTESQYFTILNDLTWEDSTTNNFIQLADLYASSLNNIYSEMPIEGENSQAKKDFANKVLESIGIANIFSSRGSNKNFEFINKCISSDEVPIEFKEE